jgi:rhamnosyltransferase
MDVSIVIRTKNEARYIEETLNKVLSQEFVGSYEIIIVDCGSTDPTLDIVQKYDVKLIHIPPKEFTYGRSLNVGTGNAKGQFVVNLSAHALLRDAKWLANLMDGFEDEKVAGVYGRQVSNGRLNPFESFQNERFFGEKKMTFALQNKTALQKLHFSNANSAIRKKVWQRFNFNERVQYAEDILWQNEVMEAGFSIVYMPDSVVYHTHKVSTYNAYKNSKDCAYALALMKQKRRSIPMVAYDVGIFLCSIPDSLLANVRYIWQESYREYLKIAPLYIMSARWGWLVGRIKYRLKR